MSLIVVSSERFAEHQTPPGHPESPERASAMDMVADEWRRRNGEIVAPREATRGGTGRFGSGSAATEVGSASFSRVARSARRQGRKMARRSCGVVRSRSSARSTNSWITLTAVVSTR